MQFNEKQSIYIQITEFVCEKILLKKWPAGEKIISIRDLAVSLEVNPNTVQRAYDFLQQLEVITNKRGVGYFVETEAVPRIVAYRKKQFIEEELPQLFRNMYLLDMKIGEVKELFEKYVKKNFNAS